MSLLEVASARATALSAEEASRSLYFQSESTRSALYDLAELNISTVRIPFISLIHFISK
jgi:hypothetical protein